MDLVFEHTHGQTDERTDRQTDVEVETALLSKDKNGLFEVHFKDVVTF